MQWGRSIEVLQEVYRSSGVKPPALASMPVLRRECRPYLEAFMALSASRDSNGYGLNPIRIGEVKDYALLMGMCQEEAVKLLRIIQAMDVKFLAYIAEKNKTS